MIGALIGKKGKNIQNIQNQSQCKILIKDYPVENGGQYISIEGKFYRTELFFEIRQTNRTMKFEPITQPDLQIKFHFSSVRNEKKYKQGDFDTARKIPGHKTVAIRPGGDSRLAGPLSFAGNFRPRLKVWLEVNRFV